MIKYGNGSTGEYRMRNSLIRDDGGTVRNEMRYETYQALERLKSGIWMEYNHEKPTIVVCVWDGADAVDSINVFTSFEKAIEARGVDIRVTLQEIDGSDLTDQAAIVLFLPTHELQSQVTAAMTSQLTDRFLVQLQHHREEWTSVLCGLKRTARSAASPEPFKGSAPAERPVYVSGTEPKVDFLKKPVKRKSPDSLRTLPPAADSESLSGLSPLHSALKSLSNGMMRKYPATENHIVILAGEGSAAQRAVSLYTALNRSAEEENFPVALHVKKIEERFLQEMSPIVLTSPTKAVYLNVHSSDAENIIKRTMMHGEILAALTFQDTVGITPRSLSLAELSAMAMGGDAEQKDEREEKLAPLPLLIPGKAVFREDAAEILASPENDGCYLVSSFRKEPERKTAPVRPKLSRIISESDGESSLMTVEQLFAMQAAEDEAAESPTLNGGDSEDSISAPQLKIQQALDEILAKSATVNPLDQPQLLVLYGTEAERRSARLFADELRDSTGWVDVKVGLSAAFGIPNLGLALRIEPAGILYAGVRRKDCERIVSMTIADGFVLPEFLVLDPRTKKRFLLYDDVPWVRQQTRQISRFFASIQPESLSSVLNHQGYRGAARALSMTQPELLSEIQSSRLCGRGGVGFPTWRKLELAAGELTFPKAVVGICASGLAEALLSRSPHLIIEGMLIAAKTIGARRGVIALQNVSPAAKAILEKAVRDAERNHLLGEDILNSGQRFDLSLRMVDGARPFGAESAILAELNGKDMFPTQRPPYPTQVGLDEKPTVVLDVRTLASLPVILREGAESFAIEGTRSSGGTQLISVRTPGGETSFLEIPMGRRLDVLILNTLGLDERRRIIGARVGERFGTYISAERFNLPLDEVTFASIPSPLVPAVEWLDGSVDLLGRVREDLIAALESGCRRCQSCTFGLEALIGKVESIRASRTMSGSELNELRDFVKGIRDSARCRYGRDAVVPLLSALSFFPSLFSGTPGSAGSNGVE